MIYDCTYRLHADLPGYPGDVETLRVESKVANNKMNSSIHLSAHFGTHIDTPKHFFADRQGLSLWDVQNLRTSVLWLSCQESHNGFTAPQDELQNIPAEAEWVFLYTGWSSRWGATDYYTGFPGIDQQLIQSLLSKDVRGLGLDAPSVDPVPDTAYHNHYAWLGDNRYILENLRFPPEVAVGKLYPTYIVPIPIESAEAAPCRVFHEVV